MKYIKYLLVAITALLCACVGPEGPRGPEGPQGEPGEGANWHVTWFTIDSNDWELVDNGPEPFYKYTVTGQSVEALDSYTAREGLLLLYVYPYGVEKDKDGRIIGDQALLPYTRYYKGYSYATDYEFYPGELTVYVTYSDFDVEVRPETFTFRLVTLW